MQAHQQQQEARKVQDRLYRGLAKNGTNVQQNDGDPLGDGDQSDLRGTPAQRQFHRNIFAEGGDLAEYFSSGLASEFAVACVTGHVPKVKALLEAANRPEQPDPPKTLVTLLERRETVMRLSPLLMIVSAGKNIGLAGTDVNLSSDMGQKQIEVAELLLSYGARPDARDVCGKTVCHYGAGMMATKMTMAVTERAAAAYKSSHFFAKRVQLTGLNNKAMNGKRGIARGFQCSTKRRAVYLLDDERQISVKPENIRLVDDNLDTKDSEVIRSERNLCNLQCRLGTVSLQETIQGSRKDVAEFLVNKLGAAIDIEDWDGVSAKSMAMTGGAEMMSSAASVIKDAATKQGRADNRANRRRCANCEKPEPDGTKFALCARCFAVRYCNKSCQTNHWNSTHKKECKKLAALAETGVKLQKPPATGMFSATINSRSGRASKPTRDGDGFRRPKGVGVDEKFYVKVQGGGPQMPFMIYDETRHCSFSYPPELQGFEQLREKVNAEPAFQGRKTYMKASFDSNGECTMYPRTASLKKW